MPTNLPLVAFIVGIVIVAVVCRWLYDHLVGEHVDRLLAGDAPDFTVDLDDVTFNFAAWDEDRYRACVNCEQFSQKEELL